MSTRYPGGIITKTPVVPTGPYESGTAPGVWTLEQQLQATKAGIWPTAGLQPDYIEDVFSTYLYTGNNAARTITNGIDLTGKGGLVWTKQRASTNEPHILVDTLRGFGQNLSTNNTAAQKVNEGSLTGFTSTGYTVSNQTVVNGLDSYTYASWTFREQPKFFDIVTYTGDGTSARAINHNLGSAPGMIVVKCTNDVSNWPVYHRSLGATQFVLLNKTDNAFSNSSYWANTEPTSTQFSVGFTNNQNSTGQTYVAYLFAHNAGGFGLTGTDNVISCGSFSSDGSGNASVTLGYEPQFILTKETNGTRGWDLFDVMRGMSVASVTSVLQANTSNAETSPAIFASPTSTGFQFTMNASKTYIYIAIRRGPMKVPTDATKVFTPIARTGTSATTTVTGAGFPPDLVMSKGRNNNESGVFDRLRGPNKMLFTTGTTAETTSTDTLMSFDMDGYTAGVDASYYNINKSTYTYINWLFRRAPGFFDEVCYSGTGAGSNAQTHNLGAVPELIITKLRTGGDTSGVGGWGVYAAALGATNVLELNLTTASAADNWFNATPTATTFYVFGNDPHSNRANGSFVAYLFATCPGVSKIGLYTGTGTTLQINCGFTGGARFVLIKRTDSTGDWYVWDSARGIVAGNDPYLLLNSTAAEVTSTDYIDTYSAGFEISSTAPAAINANGGSFIFFAVA